MSTLPLKGFDLEDVIFMFYFYILLYPHHMMNTKKRNSFVFGGDVSLGRYQNAMTPELGFEKVLGTIDLFKKADLSLVDLESVVSPLGEIGCDKGELVPYYFRGRPEMLNILSHAGIDVVSLANNHTGDYGREAFVDMLSHLEKANIDYVGGGRTAQEAQQPKIFPVGDVNVAILAVDFTFSRSAAQIDAAGHYYLNQDDLNKWIFAFKDQVEDAKRLADLVFVKMHWGNNFEKEPTEFLRHTAKLFIEDCSVDAILGTSAHVLHGVEIINNVPIIYDAGNLLFDFDFEKNVAGIFQLFVTKDGVEEVEMIPVNKQYCYTTKQDPDLESKTLSVFEQRCKNLGTDIDIKNGIASIKLSPQPKENRQKPELKLSSQKRNYVEIKPLEYPLENWIVETVPSDCHVEKMNFGPFIMHGLKITPKQMETYKTVLIESYWSLADEEVDTDYLIFQRFLSQKESLKKSIWEGDHEPCDWQWPTSRWSKGHIYYDRYMIRPPRPEFLVQGAHDLILGMAQIRTAENYAGKVEGLLEVECSLPEAG
jgi:poly-gamma-glutamate capsule biosynthesis protein CapA/YwtB (metallophosphatase superfamily)